MTNPNNLFDTGTNTTPQPAGDVLQSLQLQIQTLAKRVETLTYAQNLLQNKVIQLESQLSQHPVTSPNREPMAAVDVTRGHSPQVDALPPLQTFGDVGADPPDLWHSLVIQYNESPGYYEPYVLPVSETPTSIDRRRKNGDSKQVTLGPASNPNYWVIRLSEESGYCWLVPKANLKVTGASFDTLQALFQVHGQPAHRLTLLKPAAVQMGTNQDWELVSQGEIQFL
jgi:hypothetical protein